MQHGDADVGQTERMAFPTSFDSVLDLARLPWFEVRGGATLATMPEVGPVIDMHTHLAMGYLTKHRVDVFSPTPHTSHYLPLTAPVDLVPYSNTNLDPESMWSMKADMSVLSATPWGKRVTHTAPNLLRDMDALGIVNSVLLPFDLTFGTHNTEVFLEASKRFPRLIPFTGVHPKAKDLDEQLDRHVAAGVRGAKFHPNGQFIATDHPKVISFCNRCGQADLPILMHCGPVGIEPKAGRKRSQVYRYEKAIAENPDTTFILGHCGALQHTIALGFADKYPNVKYELSSLGLDGMRDVFAAVAPERLLYGTDWPFYHQSITLARVLILTDGDDATRRKVLHDNAAALLRLDQQEPAVSPE